MAISDLLELYVDSLQETTLKHRRDIRTSVKQISDFCGFSVIGDISSLPVERFKDSKVPSKVKKYLRKGQEFITDDAEQKFITNRTKNRKIVHFKAMLEFARRNGYLLQNPLSEFELAKVKKTERRALTKEECVELLRAAKEYSPLTWYPVIFTMINTGMRKSELVTLEWDDLDFVRSQIYLKDKPHIEIRKGETFKCKWGSGRTLPMKESLKELLENLPKTSSLVFPDQNGRLLLHNWNHRFSRAVRDAEIRNKHEITSHVLRHTFISQLISYGKVDMKRVSKLAGHKDLATTQIYTHLLGGDEEDLKAIENLPDY